MSLLTARLRLPAHITATLGALAVAALVGGLTALSPVAAGALAGGAAVLALAFLAPVAHLALVLLVTAVVPYGLQNAPTAGSAGLIISDALILTGLLRAAVVIPRMMLTRREVMVVVAIAGLLAVGVLQALHGLLRGAALSDAGFELRVILGYSAAVIALPILAVPEQRQRLFHALLFVGLPLGVSGLVQYFANIELWEGWDFGARNEVDYAAGARSVQGGLFGFPVAVLIGVAALISGAKMSVATRTAVALMVVLNAASLLVTYERTFWVATALGVGFVVVRAGVVRGTKAVAVLLAAATSALAVFSVFQPSALSAAQSRLASVREYRSDDSLRIRMREGQLVLDRIQERPLTGWGLGDKVRWGIPWLLVRAENHGWSHSGYLWLAWKLGLPAAVLLVALVGWCVVARGPPALDPMSRHVREGAQASLLVLLLVSVMFSAFGTVAITAVLGTLVMLCLRGDTAAAGGDDPAQTDAHAPRWA